MPYPKPRLHRRKIHSAVATTALAAAIILGSTGGAALAQDPLRVTLPDGRALAMRCRGVGAPTVVIDAGLGSPAIGSPWETIADRVSTVTRICLYDRIGLGRSEGTIRVGRASSDVVADLRVALALMGEWGPYVLVGHSVGGANMLVFAGNHPEAVAGLVLVDSSHPDQTAMWLAELPPPTTDEERGVAEARQYLDGLQANPTANPERLDLSRVADEARAVTAVDGPLVVLTHSPRWRMAAGLPEPLAERLEAASQRLQVSFLGLSSDAYQLVSANGGHDLPREEPDLVTGGILLVVAKVRATDGQGAGITP